MLYIEHLFPKSLIMYCVLLDESCQQVQSGLILVSSHYGESCCIIMILLQMDQQLSMLYNDHNLAP